ncbi:hypothetical protein Q3G72_029412 [Acer saccharum]|nr:hypothetical protein Q3G72_029412 [Acer saccharum]
MRLLARLRQVRQMRWILPFERLPYILRLVVALAGPTAAIQALACEQGVGLIEDVASFAACFEGILRRGSLATGHVQLLRHSLQMVRVDAGTHAAQVVDVGAFGNAPMGDDVGESVGADLLALE